MATKLELDKVYKIYGDGSIAVSNFNLQVLDKEFIVLVGPSGCGKSTTLRMIAGLEEISEGELRIKGKVMNNVPPKDRDIAMVFQNYALYQHKSVYENMAFGLKLRKLPKDEIKKLVNNAATILGLEDHLNKKPKDLSGGQQQRVALGRAIVRDAELFLMDEPLSNLDAKLRVQMRAEITKLHQRLNTTTVYVTHDQTEAMTMATRLVVMKDGFIQQIGSPKEVYENPDNVFVGGFIGFPAMNFFEGTLKNGHFVVGNASLKIPQNKLSMLTKRNLDGKDVILGVRPEHIHLKSDMPSHDSESVVEVTVDASELTGPELMVYTSIGEQTFIARLHAEATVLPNQVVKLYVDMKKAHFFEKETENRIK
ncbi:ABC transporter ATP-binding protein [Sporosarcina highlanderae]|uniref:Sn-glycerol-3-phosphate ABC transporter ATP-binding protein UgpC n=1 Tax=Sporosarcina highlanderae TaxID=3035916 RepID=A0ABT8JSA8_9BACL|nr:sn-glycerol-3-phosphate ABC transporter ATP-binding protein UgpC [Sporosarcina highlanderae]MDN4608043.1 sn-glycerol-3-phosphate ABC transporter ATP-binding protein UgpC [Sporosarcina highlanderae]